MLGNDLRGLLCQCPRQGVQQRHARIGIHPKHGAGESFRDDRGDIGQGGMPISGVGRAHGFRAPRREAAAAICVRLFRCATFRVTTGRSGGR
jgi:hypothetical protein